MFDKLYNDCISSYYDSHLCNVDGIKTFEYEKDRDSWRYIEMKIKKTFVNNPIDEKVEIDIIEKIKAFDDSEDDYENFGQPYKTGFLFHGKPGTGKTSFILTLANEFKKGIYYGNASLIHSDFPAKVMKEIKPGSFLVFEDIDLIIKNIIAKRKDEKKEVEPKTGNKVIKSKEEVPQKPLINDNGGKINIFNVTKEKSNGDGGGGGDIFGEMIKSYKSAIFRRILEVLDGYKFLHGVIVIFTTNYIDDIDSALIRPGRIDYCYEFKECTSLQIKKICDLYGVNGNFTGKKITSAELITKCRILGKRKRNENENKKNKKFKSD